MTTRLIEDCLNDELLEEGTYNEYISINLKGVDVFVVDPYMINVRDLIDPKPGKFILVRARRPAWGVGDLNRYIYLIRKENKNGL